MNKMLSLVDGIQIPQMGFGTWELKDPKQATLHALHSGYRHIDTADYYHNHVEVGQAMKASGVPRDQIFLVTKLYGRTLEPKNVAPAIDRFLKELDVEQIDLLLVHWLSGVPGEDGLMAMDKARTAGKVRTLGVSNFEVEDMQAALATGLPVCNNQIEYNLEVRPDDVADFCLANDVTVTAYSPVKVSGGAKARTLVAKLAEEYHFTAEQVILAWLMAKGFIVIPRSNNPKHIESNFRSLEVTLKKEDVAALDTSA
ncbi:MAG TPA: aldo/keto reductase [Anaerolineales bacterium]|nr:aldo/keto reductase [Anaerolineales bacterium]HRQ92920.1 aldo/keto reductase [Anaerolineales bacterium]